MCPRTDEMLMTSGIGSGIRPGQNSFERGSPDGIRTRATALRGRRARPLHNGALAARPNACTDRATEAYQSVDLSSESEPPSLGY
jgi:hypothetical protein